MKLSNTHGRTPPNRSEEIGRGLVDRCFAVGVKSERQMNSTLFIEAINAGVPIQEFGSLQKILDVNAARLMGLIVLNKATFSRRKRTGRLDPSQSDRLVRYTLLTKKALEVFGNLADARSWLNASQIGLGGAVPLDYAKTEVGARVVEDLLNQIDFGVY